MEDFQRLRQPSWVTETGPENSQRYLNRPWLSEARINHYSKDLTQCVGCTWPFSFSLGKPQLIGVDLPTGSRTSARFVFRGPQYCYLCGGRGDRGESGRSPEECLGGRKAKVE
jgi:hypothetical protein